MDFMKEMEKKNSKILVITPAYNEEECVGGVLTEIKEKAPWVDIVVVDDGSNDQTAEIARKNNAEVISLPINLGIGGTVQTGFKYAVLNRYHIAVQVDADMQHDLSYLTSLIKPLVEEKADIVIGSRYLNDDPMKMPLIRNIGIRYFSWLTSKIIGYEITDCSSGFRAMNMKAIKLYSKNYPIDFPDAEALVLAHICGLKIIEVPVTFRKREKGQTSLSFWRLLYYPFKEMISILMLLAKKQKHKMNLMNTSL